MDDTHQHAMTEAEAVAAEHAPHDDAAHIAAHVNKYLFVGLLLLVGTGLTVGLSYVDFGTRKANITIAMLLAAGKATLVALIFMHLQAEKKLIYRILVFTGFFVLALFWLTYLHWYDPIVH